MEVNKAFKFRIYPRKEDLELLEKHFGANRFIWNYFLDLKKKTYLESKKSLSYNQCCKLLTELKQKEEYAWLYEVDAQSLQKTIKHLDGAYDRFFRKISKFPRFKSKKDNKKSYTISQCFKLDIDKNLLKLSKFKIPFKFRGKFSGTLIKANSVTISKTPTGKYFASLQGIFDIPERAKSDKEVGIDLGLKDFLITSEGDKLENPKFLKKRLKKLKYLQRQHSKKKGKSREKARKLLVRQHEKVANQRKDYLHKVSSRLIDENQVICIEDLAVKNMIKNRHLSQAISDVSWGMFVSFLTYKVEWYKRDIRKIDRFFPSSKTCSKCGFIHQELKLHHRTWTCVSCGTEHDRDINAAKNILRQGLNLSGLATKSDIKQKAQESSSVEEAMNE